MFRGHLDYFQGPSHGSRSSVAFFFILEVGGGIMKRRKIEYFKMLLCLLIENHQRHQTVRSFMANHCQKHSPLLRLVLQALLHPSIDPRMKTLRMQTTIHNLSGVPCGAFCIPIFSVCVATLKAQTLTLSLNVLMLYGNMEQLAKLSMSVFALLA